MKPTNIYPFNERGNPEKIKNEKITQLFYKMKDGYKLNRDEKNNLFHQIQSNSGKGYYMLMGCIIPFNQFMNKYLVKYKYEPSTYREIFAFDKTCIRNCFYTNRDIKEIIQMKETNHK